MSKWEENSPDELIHYGVKGMKWGVRHDPDSGALRTQSGIVVEPGIHSGTKDAAVQVSGLMRDRYGLNLRNVKTIGPGHPEYPDTMAFVEPNFNNANNGRNEGNIFIQAQDLTGKLRVNEKNGWLAPGCGNTKALLTHESSHSLFHANQSVKVGLLGNVKVKGGNIEARDKAFRAAAKAAHRDGVSIWSTSGYASTAGVREELEGELFSRYHWGTDPPRFVEVWGQTLHKELGVDPTPFKEVK